MMPNRCCAEFESHTPEAGKVSEQLLVWSAVSMLLAMLAAGCAISAVNLHKERTAEALLRDTSSLKVGESPEKDVQRVVARYHGYSTPSTGLCGPDKPYSASVSNPDLNWLGGMSPSLRPFGNRYWMVDISFGIAGGRLCAVVYYIRALRADGEYEVLVKVSDEVFPSPLYSPPPYQISAQTFKNFLRFNVYLTTAATPDERQRALGFDLSCLTRHNGCSSGCEIVPEAWIDLQKNAHPEGQALPVEEINNPKCKQLTDLR